MPMFKNEYPYTNIHEINLDWIIKNVEEIRAMVDKYIINYEQITFADPIGWEYAVAYPMHTIVLDQSYNAYLSKQDVPSYTQLGDSDYWLKIGDFFQYIEKALSNIAYNETTSATASKSYAVGDLLINNDILYRVMIQLPAGSTFVIGTNIEQVTVEQLLDEMKTDLSADIAANTQAIALNTGNITTLTDGLADVRSDLTADITALETATNTKIDTLEANFAPIETSPSTRAYGINNYLIYKDALYKTTRAIAVGDTLTVGTNIVRDTFATENSYEDFTSLVSFSGSVATGGTHFVKKGSKVFFTYQGPIVTLAQQDLILTIPEGYRPILNWYFVFTVNAAAYGNCVLSSSTGECTINQLSASTSGRLYMSGSWDIA